MNRYRPSMSEPGEMIPADDGEWCLYAEGDADLRETLKAVLYYFGPEGAQKVTAHALEARKARALKGTKP